MNQPILTLNQIGHRFGATVVLSDINLAVATGETLAIIGPNGAGKSTLFNLISGAMRPHTGTISLNGQAIQGLPVQQVTRRGIGRSFQISQLFDSLTVEESIIAASFWQSGKGHQFWRPLRGAGSLKKLDVSPCGLQQRLRYHTRWIAPLFIDAHMYACT